MQVYCLGCRTHREIQDAEKVAMKNGRNSIRGRCSVCGRRVSRIAPSSMAREAVGARRTGARAV